MRQAEHITRALKGHWHGGYGVCFCPAHRNDRTPALSVSENAGRLLLHCHAGCSFTDVLDALKARGLVEGQSHYEPPSRAELQKLDRERQAAADRKERLVLNIWKEAVPITGTVAETYLRHRGITCPLPDTLRFHPSCWHPSGQSLPALVALVDGSDRAAIHRTYLKRDGAGKADANPDKAMLGNVAGGAVRLSGGHDALVVCEGIETGLSLLSGLLGRPARVWAALSTSGMKRMTLPETPGTLTIATDGDEPGKEAGNALAMRATALGWRVSLLPAPNGRDWNDILTMKGAA